MDKNKAVEIKQHCRKYEYFLESIEGDLFTWAGKKHIAKVFETKIKQLGDRSIVETMPPGWYLMTKKAFCFARMFENPVNAGKVIKTYKEHLTDSDLELLQTFAKKSWFFALFSVKERIAEDLFLIYDFWKDDEYLLKSASLEELFGEGKKLFFSLLFDNGQCCQSYGVMNYYQGLVPEDFESFAKLANPNIYAQKGLRGVVSQESVAFFLLFAYAEMPAMGSGGQRIYFYSSRIKTKGFDTSGLKHYYAGEQEGITKWTVSFDESNILGCNLYFDSKHKTFTIYTASLEDYKASVDLVSDLIQVPLEPEHKVSSIILTAAEEVLGKPVPGSEYDELFAEKAVDQDTQENDEELLENLYQVLIEDAFLGSESDIKTLTEDYGMPEFAVENLKAAASKNVGNFHPPVSGGLKRIKVPEIGFLQRLLVKTDDCEVFTFNSEENVAPMLEDIKKRMEQTGEGWQTDELDIESIKLTLGSFFAHIFNKGNYFLNYTIYLLLQKGDQPFSYHDYAVELIRAGWFFFTAEPDTDTFHSAIHNFGLLCLRALEPLGLIDIVGDVHPASWEGKPFKIKRSEFFEKWISLAG